METKFRLVFTLILGFICLDFPLVKAQISTSMGLVNLPATQILIDSAYDHSPLLKTQELKVEQRVLVTELKKIDYLKAVKLNSAYVLGTNLDGNVASPFNSGFTQWYSVGASIAMPISSLLGRKEEIKIADLESQIVNENAENIKREIAILIHRLVLDIDLKKKVLVLRNEQVIVSNMQYEYAKVEFENNTLEVSEFGKLNDANVKARVLFEKAKNEYLQLLRQLELITGLTLI